MNDLQNNLKIWQDESGMIKASDFRNFLNNELSELGISVSTDENDSEPINNGGVEVVIPLWNKEEVLKRKQENKPVERNQHGFVVNQEREEIKQKVFDKKGYVCSDCGVREDLDVHHILPRKMWWRDIISNLKVLCRDCHEKLHWYEIIDDTENKGKWPSKKLILIHKAMDENLKLFIVYKKFDEDQEDYITRRVIDPMELYYENGRQYLKAYCHLRKQQRNFRISRIAKIELR